MAREESGPWCWSLWGGLFWRAGGIKGILLGMLLLDRRIKGNRAACRSVCFFHPLSLIFDFRRSEIIWSWSRSWRKSSDPSRGLLSLLRGQRAGSDTVREDDSSETSLSTAFPLGPAVLWAFFSASMLLNCIVEKVFSVLTVMWNGNVHFFHRVGGTAWFHCVPSQELYSALEKLQWLVKIYLREKTNFVLKPLHFLLKMVGPQCLMNICREHVDVFVRHRAVLTLYF